MPGENITAIILAGGQGTRMGGVDKGLVDYQAKPLIEHVLARIQPQVAQIIISANRNLERYRRYGYPVVSDLWPDYRGPLAGLLSALAEVKTEYVLCVPCDCPHLPNDLVPRLAETLSKPSADISVAVTEDGMQAVCFLAHREVGKGLQDYLAAGNRKVQDWLRSNRLVYTDFSGQAYAFANINSPRALQSTGSP